MVESWCRGGGGGRERADACDHAGECGVEEAVGGVEVLQFETCAGEDAVGVET